MKRIFFFLMSWITLMPFSGGAQGMEKVSDPERVYAELKKSSESVNTISADFKETRYATYLKEPQSLSGRFFYGKKDRMRWEQQIPASYIILIDGVVMRVSEAGKEKNVRAAGNVGGMVRDMLLMMVSGDYQSAKGFDKQLFQDHASYMMVMKPVEKKLRQRYEKLEVIFSRQTKGVKQLTFFEKGGDKQVMNFLNEKFNVPVDPKLFKEF